jgi:hypothetical protein
LLQITRKTKTSAAGYSFDQHRRFAVIWHQVKIAYIKQYLKPLDTMAPKKLPPGFPLKTVIDPVSFTVFKVPRHIVRIDIFEPGRAGTHGWQVRYKGATRMFSDAHYGKASGGSPAKALKAAIVHLANIYVGPVPKLRSSGAKTKSNPDLESGIREAWQIKRGRNPQLYIEATSPTDGVVARRFYVGSTTTITPARYESALQRAREKRAKFVQDHLAEQRERGWV